MNFNQQDIDQIVRNFRNEPNIENYQFIDKWYENNVSFSPNQEHMICIYLFLLGANIRYRYKPFTYDQHMEYIKEIRDILQNSDPLNKAQRKAYFDFGNKSGFYR